MVALPISDEDPMLEAVDRAIEENENRKPPRDYLGMSGIGHPCARKSYYDWRWFSVSFFPASALKRFEDGHHGEDVQAARLRMVAGVTLLTIDPATGKQFAYLDINGHFKGHTDGAILGLLQAPKTWHVWEHKQVDEKKQKKLSSLKIDRGEKNALAAWDETYYNQATLYMNYSGMSRHYLTCSTPGGRHTISVRTDLDVATAIRTRAKAERIITNQNPPERISNDPAFYMCRRCNHSGCCHGDQLPIRTCRSCAFSTPIADGKWYCEHHQCNLTYKEQRAGCNFHKHNPANVKGEQIDAADDASWIEYKMSNSKIIWRDNGI